MSQVIIVIILLLVDLFIELSELSISSVNVKYMEDYKYLYPLKYFKKKISSFLMLNLIYNNIIQYFIGKYINECNGAAIFIINGLAIYLNIILKSLVINKPEPVAYILSYIMFIPNFIFQFAGYILSMIGSGTLWLFGFKKSKQSPSIQAYRKELLWDIGIHANLAEEMEELKIIKSALQFREVEVYKIMTEREHFVTFNVDNSIEQILYNIQHIDKQRNLIAVDKHNNIIGTVNKVDILSDYLHNNNFNIYSIIKPPLFISQHITLNAVIKHFTANSRSSLFIINSFMDIVGIVTLHDVVQEIFGIDDDDYYFEKINHGYIVDAEYNTRVLNRKMNWNIPDQYITIGDFILYLCNWQCQINQIIKWNNMIFIVRSIKNSQPYRVFIKYIPIPQISSEEE